MRYLITISYDGTEFSGYQKQPRERTVQGELEKALKEISGGKKIDVHASGRTDAGVHAMAQRVHFDLETKITCEKLSKALNSLLPKDIFVRRVEEVPSEFHARFSAIGKEYIYKLNMGEYNPLERNYVFQYNYNLDVKAMADAIRVFMGTHDFRAFVTESKEKENCVRTIYRASIERKDDKIEITFKGDGFLRYQIRNMVGMLIQVGENKISTEDVEKYLENKDRTTGGKTAPAEGLYLIDVEY